MKDWADRIAIAETCGWQRLDAAIGRQPPYRDIWVNPERDGHGYVLTSLPDYLNDLNAIRDAVATLGQTLQTAFSSVLWTICGSPHAAIHATAAQRAEAFLRVTAYRRSSNP